MYLIYDSSKNYSTEKRNTKSVDDKLKELMNKETTKYTASKVTDFAEIQKDKKSLPSLINSIIQDLELVKEKDEYFEHYYNTAQSYLKLNEKMKMPTKILKEKPVTITQAKVEATNKKLEKIHDENNLLTSKTGGASTNKQNNNKVIIEDEDEFVI